MASTFQTEDEASSTRANEAVAQRDRGATVAELDASLSTDTSAPRRRPLPLVGALTSTWGSVADGSRDGFDGCPSDATTSG